MQTPTLSAGFSLVRAASRATGIKHSRIYSTSKDFTVVRVRWAIFLTLRRRGWTLHTIAAEFGMTHTNIVHGLHQATTILARKDSWFTALVNVLNTPPAES